jgi:hypothetical protein
MFTLWTQQELSSRQPAGLLEALRSGGDSWVPEAFGPHEPLRRGGGEGFRSLWRAEANESTGTILFRTRRNVGAEGTIHWDRTPHRLLDSVTMTLPLDRFRTRGQELWKIAERLFSWASANRDEDEFECSAEFRLDRTSNRHLAFGHGMHFCLGAALARLEAQEVFKAIMHRMPALALAEAPVWRDTYVLRGLRELLVRV